MGEQCEQECQGDDHGDTMLSRCRNVAGAALPKTIHLRNARRPVAHNFSERNCAGGAATYEPGSFGSVSDPVAHALAAGRRVRRIDDLPDVLLSLEQARYHASGRGQDWA